MKSFYMFVLCALVTVVVARELPSYIPLCKKSSPTFNDCLLKGTSVLQPRLAKGIKELNIPPLEPLEIPMVKLEQGTSAVNYKATLVQIQLYGLTNYKFSEISLEFGNNIILKGKTALPKIRLESDYDITGKLLLLPIQGNGRFHANITDCTATFTTTCNVIQKKGVEYLRSKDTQLHLEFGDGMLNFENLFNGDPLLSKTTNDFFNDNAKDLLNEVKPAIEAVAGMLVDEVINQVFKTVPYKKLLPE